MARAPSRTRSDTRSYDRSRTRARPAARPSPWWLAEGDEECLACGGFYVYELEFRCPDCDTVTCLHCRRRGHDGRMVCVSCAEAQSAGGRHGG
jgi:hypothetical protein